MKELKDCEIKYSNKYGERFKLEIFPLEEGSDDYSMWLSIIPEDNEPEAIFSTWIDSGCGEVNGNQEIYRSDYEDEINRAYAIFQNLMNVIYADTIEQ